MRKAKIEIVNTTHWNKQVFWWRLRGANGKIICHSETFPTRANALRAARRMLVLAKEAEVVK